MTPTDREYDAVRCMQHGRDLEHLSEQMKTLQTALEERNEILTEAKSLRIELGHARDEIKEIKSKLDTFCAREDFVLLRTQWYYFVGLLATGVVGGILALLFQSRVYP